MRRSNNKSWKWLVAGAAVFVPTSVLAVSVPHTFSAGTAISSGDVNQNFGALETAVTNLETGKADAPATGTVMPSAQGKMTYLYSGPCEGATSPNCVPNPLYKFSTDAVSPTITRTGTGTYEVTVPGFAASNSHVQVTGYGGNPNYCKVNGWGAGVVDVDCYTPTGVKVDNEFTLLVVN